MRAKPRHKASRTVALQTRHSGWYPWLDSVKGLGILLVVLGHASLIGPLNRTLYAFHMPLFFIISGLLFKERPLHETLRRKAQHLLIPYFTFAVLTFTYWSLIERRLRPGNYSVLNAFLNIFIARGGIDNNPYNVVLWFLPCLFMTEMLFAAVFALIAGVTKNRNENATRNVLIAVSMVVAFVLAYLATLMTPLFRLPFTLDIVPFAYGFYAIGYLAKPVVPMLARCAQMRPLPRLALIAPAGALYTALTVLTVSTNLKVDLNSGVASNVPLLIVTAILGTAATFLLCIAVDNMFLRYWGGGIINYHVRT